MVRLSMLLWLSLGLHCSNAGWEKIWQTEQDRLSAAQNNWQNLDPTPFCGLSAWFKAGTSVVAPLPAHDEQFFMPRQATGCFSQANHACASSTKKHPIAPR